MGDRVITLTLHGKDGIGTPYIFPHPFAPTTFDAFCDAAILMLEQTPENIVDRSFSAEMTGVRSGRSIEVEDLSPDQLAREMWTSLGLS